MLIKPELIDLYKIMFLEYPDVLNVEQLGRMLGVSLKTVYRLLKSGKIKSLYFGKRYKIPKLFVVEYLTDLKKSGA